MTDNNKTGKFWKKWLIWLALIPFLALIVGNVKQNEQTRQAVAREVVLQQEVLQLQRNLLLDDAIFSGQIARARQFLQIMDTSSKHPSVEKQLRLAFLDQQLSQKLQNQNQLQQLQQQQQFQIQKLQSEQANLNQKYFADKAELSLKIQRAEAVHIQLLDSVVALNNVIVQERNALQQLSFMNKTNRVFYIGEVQDSMANGNGHGIWQTGGIYTGEWHNNLRHGYGKYRWVDGELYQGEYVADRRQGQGTYYWLNGDSYTGEWQQDRRNGYGELRNSTGKIISKGKWKDDQLVASIPEN